MDREFYKKENALCCYDFYSVGLDIDKNFLTREYWKHLYPTADIDNCFMNVSGVVDVLDWVEIILRGTSNYAIIVISINDGVYICKTNNIEEYSVDCYEEIDDTMMPFLLSNCDRIGLIEETFDDCWDIIDWNDE